MIKSKIKAFDMGDYVILEMWRTADIIAGDQVDSKIEPFIGCTAVGGWVVDEDEDCEYFVTSTSITKENVRNLVTVLDNLLEGC